MWEHHESTPMKTYSLVSPSDQDQRADVDADVIVIGAGVAGSSIAHWCSSIDQKCQVMVLDQFNYETQSEGSPTETFWLNHGSSRGGPRRIGTIAGDDRTRKAWRMWQYMNSRNDNDNDLMDIAGEVYVFALFPLGWFFLATISLYMMVFPTSKPDGFQFLLSASMIEKKLGKQQGFSNCWSGCVGIYYKEAAALHTDKILRYFLKESGNLRVKYGKQVTDISLVDENNESATNGVKVTVRDKDSSTGDSVQLRCHHLVIAGGGWTEELLRCLCQKKDGSHAEVIKDIKTSIEVFTCPVYKVQRDEENEYVNEPPPFSIASGCPLFSCISSKVYGFPINHKRLENDKSPLYLSLRPFYKASDSEDPDNQTICEEQRNSIDEFVKECFDVGNNYKVTSSHYYTCRYPKLSLDGGKRFQTVFDFVPGTNQQIVVVAGLDGYSFKFGSIYGMEFLDLLETGKSPKGFEWPRETNEESRSFVLRMFHAVFRALLDAVASKRIKRQDAKKET